MEPAGRTLEPAGRALEPAGRPGASWEGPGASWEARSQLGGPAERPEGGQRKERENRAQKLTNELFPGSLSWILQKFLKKQSSVDDEMKACHYLPLDSSKDFCFT